jgi:hypothetical protein
LGVAAVAITWFLPCYNLDQLMPVTLYDGEDLIIQYSVRSGVLSCYARMRSVVYRVMFYVFEQLAFVVKGSAAWSIELSA